MQPGWCQPVKQEFMENECEALPGVAYPRVRDNRSTINTKTGYDDDDDSAKPDPGWPQKTATTAFEVICGWSVAGTVFYNVIFTLRWHQSLHRLLVADLPQLDQLTLCTSRQLTRRLCLITVVALREGILMISGSELLEIAIWIIQNEKIIQFQPKKNVWIKRQLELLERIWWVGLTSVYYIYV